MNIFERIRKAWGPDTAYGTYQGGPWGQCAVTALVVQDLFGGDLLRAVIPGHGSCYWNRIPGMGEVDLTREQYGDDVPIPRGVVVPRSRLLEGERAAEARTLERYLLLRERVSHAALHWRDE